MTSASAPELKDVLRRLKARTDTRPQTDTLKDLHFTIMKNTTLRQTTALAALIQEICALDSSPIGAVEAAFRANEKEKSHLRELS
ncbi:hypothetical protein WAI453_002253 [Rhynchosporium graminicola]